LPATRLNGPIIHLAFSRRATDLHLCFAPVHESRQNLPACMHPQSKLPSSSMEAAPVHKREQVRSPERSLPQLETEITESIDLRCVSGTFTKSWA
jgi:hypothetical protein